nr:MAG TPA: minor capsid protein [Caudoviricetes sp.]
MLTPDYLDTLPDAVVELWQQVEDDILRDIARRIRKLDELDRLTDTATWQAWRLEQVQACHQDVVHLLAKYSGKSKEAIRHALLDAGLETLARDDELYQALGFAPSAIDTNESLNNLLNAGYRQTLGTWQNLTATTAHTVTGEFERALDRVWLQVSSGAFDYKTAIKRAVDGLTGHMAGVTYPSGHRDTLEVAVRRAVLTGVNQTCAQLQLTRAEEVGCEFVEVTAHGGARPEHAVWQGKVYHIGGAVELDGVWYEDFETATGYGTGPGLCGWNCRHNFYPFFPGVSVRNYTDERLAELNARDVEYNGKRYTRYEISQMQRALERQVRKLKRRYLAEDAAGVDTTAAAVKLRAARKDLNDFVRATGGRSDSARTSVSEFGHSQASKATAVAKKQETLYNEKKREALAVIRSSDTPKTLNIGNQRKHIREEGRDLGNRSFLYGTLDDAQQLVNQYSGTGEPKLDRKGNWVHKEHVTVDRVIGEVVDLDTGEATPTHRFAIHYGKRGTHIVPAKEDDHK